MFGGDEPDTTPPLPTADIPGVSSRMMKIGVDLDLPLKACQEVMLITGTRGTGKSYTVGVVLEELHKNGVSFCVMDALGAHRGIVLPGVKVINVKAGETVDTDKLVEKLLTTNSSYIINMMDLFDPKKQQKIVGDFCIKLLSSNPSDRGKVIVTVIEEAEEFAPAGTAKFVYESIIPLNRLTKLGRARGCGVIFVTQRPQDMSSKLRSQASQWITHRLTNYTELDIMQKQLVAATRGETQPIKQKIFGFRPGEAMILSAYLPDGIAFTKIRPRETHHAGRNVIEDGVGGLVSPLPHPAAASSAGSGFFGWGNKAEPVVAMGAVGKKEDADGIIKTSRTDGESFDNLVKLAVLALAGVTGYVVYDSYQKRKAIEFDKGEADISAYREVVFKEPVDDGGKKKGGKKKEAQPEDIEKLDVDSMLALGRTSTNKERKILSPPVDDDPNPLGYNPFGDQR